MNITRGAITIAFLSGLGLVACSNTAAVVETMDVKAALMADRSVDASHIDVDTFPETKTIVLRGSVKTATQRDEAARIAAVEAPGYQIDNQLRVVRDPALRPFR